MAIIDSHVHLKHGDPAGTEYLAEDIIGYMDEVGIDWSVVFAMATTTRHSIEMAEEAVKEYPGRLIPYVYALPHYERPVIGEIDEAITNYGFKGIKIHAAECRLTDYTIDPVLELATRREVPCLFDFCGYRASAERIARAFPECTVIAAHMGKYLCEDEKLVEGFITLAEEFPNVYLDVSGVVLTGKIVEAVSRIGAKRLVFGTDGPHRKPDIATFAKDEIEKIRGLDITENDKADILGETISYLLRI